MSENDKLRRAGNAAPIDRRASPRASASDRRNDPRFQIDLPAHVTIRGEKVLCQLIDISEHGALVQTSGPVHVGDKVSLDLPNIGPTIATVLRITPTHMAMIFPGAVVISSLLPKDGFRP